MSKPWVVVGYAKNGFSRISGELHFGTRSEAEMHAQSLNKLSSRITYKVIFDDKAVLIA